MAAKRSWTQDAVTLGIQYVDPKSLKPDPNNARRHTALQVRQLAASIKAFGFNNPLVIDADGLVLVGNARLKAALKIGCEQVPIIQVSHLTPGMAAAYAIADNKLTDNSSFDPQQLGLTFKVLSELDLDFPLEATGFSMGEIDPLIEGLGELEAPEDDLDDAPPPSGPRICKAGDRWVLGKHRVVCASALEASSYAALLINEKVAASFCDPPYGGSIKSYLGHKRKRAHREFVQGSTDMSGPELTAFLTQATRVVAEHSADGSIHFWCMDWRHLTSMVAAGRLAFADLLNICVWAKPNGGMGSLYRSAHEFVLVFVCGCGSHRNNVQLGRFGRNRTNVWSYAGANGFVRSSEEADLLAQHPTPKPVALVSDAILDVTARDDVVLDAFLGSGTTLIACERVGRRCRGLELDPLYVDLTIRRWQRITGEKAIHEVSGQSFDELAALAEDSE